MAETKFKEEVFHGQTIEYYVDKFGLFYAQIGGASVAHGRDLENVEKLAKSKARQSKVIVDVPFVYSVGASGLGYGGKNFELIRARAKSLHAGNDDVLAEAGSEKLRLNYREARTTYADMSDGEMEEGRRLNEHLVAAREAFQAWEKEHEIDLQGTVRSAVKEAQEHQS